MKTTRDDYPDITFPAPTGDAVLDHANETIEIGCYGDEPRIAARNIAQLIAAMEVRHERMGVVTTRDANVRALLDHLGAGPDYIESLKRSIRRVGGRIATLNLVLGGKH